MSDDKLEELDFIKVADLISKLWLFLVEFYIRSYHKAKKILYLKKKL